MSAGVTGRRSSLLAVLVLGVKHVLNAVAICFNLIQTVAQFNVEKEVEHVRNTPLGSRNWSRRRERELNSFCSMGACSRSVLPSGIARESADGPPGQRKMTRYFEIPEKHTWHPR